MGGLTGGPVKAAHHNRPGMGGHTRNSGGSGSGGGTTGSLDDSRQSPNHSFNAQGTSLHHSIHSLGGSSNNSGSSAPGASSVSGENNDQRSSPANRARGPNHRGGAGSSSGQPQGNISLGSS